MSKLRIEDNTYPSGAKYRTIYGGKERIGSYDVVEGGFKPFGCRKVRPSEQDTQREVISRYEKRHQDLASLAEELWFAVSADRDVQEN